MAKFSFSYNSNRSGGTFRTLAMGGAYTYYRWLIYTHVIYCNIGSVSLLRENCFYQLFARRVFSCSLFTPHFNSGFVRFHCMGAR